MSVLVTGGAGFIGSHLVDKLVAQGEEVTVIDDLSEGRTVNISGHLKSGSVRLVVGSILDRPLMLSLIASASVVYHLAAIVGVDKAYQESYKMLKTNIEGTQTVLETCKQFSVNVVLASSSEVYGKNLNVPVIETDDTVLGKTSIPRWGYAVTKLANEHLAWSFKSDIAVALLRYFNCYGPRLHPFGYYSFVISLFIKQALKGLPITVHGDGQQTRSFTYIDDTIDATVAASKISQTETFNICRPIQTSISDLAVLVKKLTGSKSPIVKQPRPKIFEPFEETRHRNGTIDKAKKQLDFNPDIDLETGINRTIEWLEPRLYELEKEQAAS